MTSPPRPDLPSNPGTAGRHGSAGPGLLRVVGLTKVFRTDGGPVHALRGVDLTMDQGEFVAVMGPSGSGKSTLLHVLGGLEPVSTGQIWLNGDRVDGLSQGRWALLRRHHIGFVFQFFNLVSNLTVADNVELPVLISGASRRAARDRREELLSQLGLAAKADMTPGRLSGGEQQRVALARAIAHRPSLLLADEPTGNLDSANAADVLALLSASHGDGQAILLVTHDARAASMADRVVSLFDGVIADDVKLPPVRMPVAATGVLELKG